MENLKQIIETAFENKAEITSLNATTELKHAIHEAIDGLNVGHFRVAEKVGDKWVIHQWLKKAILLFFRIQDNQPIESATTTYFDKVPLKYSDYQADDFAQEKVRIVPGAIVRTASFIGKNTVVMPSFVNIGAYIDTGCMVDTWATVGSCAQIGKSVHLSGGAGIGGVLEPLQANPTIIEDNCFIGARSEVVEGVIVKEGSVLSMGVYIGQSTPIYHRERDEVLYGEVPPYSVVIPGTLPHKSGAYQGYAAIIVKQVDEKTRRKVSINELLRA